MTGTDFYYFPLTWILQSHCSHKTLLWILFWLRVLNRFFFIAYWITVTSCEEPSFQSEAQTDGTGLAAHTYYLLLVKYGMKVIGRNKDTTNICTLHSSSAARFCISSISSYQKDTVIWENNSTCVRIQQNLDAWVTCWTSLHVIFCTDIRSSTHVYHMDPCTFRSESGTIWIQLQRLHKSHIVKIGSREAEMWPWIHKSPSTRRGIFLWHRKKEQVCLGRRTLPDQKSLQYGPNQNLRGFVTLMT